MVGGNGRDLRGGSPASGIYEGVSGQPEAERRCKRCFRWRPVAAFVGKRRRVCVTCDECRAYVWEHVRASREKRQAVEGWEVGEPGWEECLRCEVRPDCDESDPRCGRRQVLERMQAGDIEARALVVPPGYVSLPELAAELGLVRQALYGRIERGTLAAERWRIGNRDRWLVPGEAGGGETW